MAIDDNVVVPKMIAEDRSTSIILHRDITVADGIDEAISTAPDAHPDGQIVRLGSSLMLTRIFCANGTNDLSGETMRFAAYLFPASYNASNLPTSVVLRYGAGLKIADFTVNLKAAGQSNAKHPITGETTTGINWYEMSYVVTNTFHINPNWVRLINNVDDATPMLMQVDMMAFNGMYIEPIEATNIARIAIGCLRLN